MKPIAIGEALVSGFALVVKRPLAVLCWGLACTALLILPLVMLGGAVISGVHDLIVAHQNHADNGPQAEAGVIRIMSGVFLAIPVLVICILAVQALLSGAVYRAVLEPQNRGFASLRFGKQELWLVVLALARHFVLSFIMGGVMLAAFVVALAGILIGGLFPQPWAGIVRAPFLIAAVAGGASAAVWVWLRFSLAGPMTFAEREFRLFESWSLTRGRVKELLGLGVLMLIVRQGLPMLLVAPIWACFVIVMAGGAGFIEFTHATTGSLANGEVDPWLVLSALAPVLVVIALVALLAIGAFGAVFLAPWAEVYRQIKSEAKPDHPPVF